MLTFGHLRNPKEDFKTFKSGDKAIVRTHGIQKQELEQLKQKNRDLESSSKAQLEEKQKVMKTQIILS